MLLGAGSATAQDLGFWIDAATHYAQPPAGVAGDATLYGTLGGRLEVKGSPGGLALIGGYGRALSNDGEWIQGSGRVYAGQRIGNVGLRVGLGGFGLRYLEPFEYDAAGAEILPVASLSLGGVALSLRPRLLRGGWSADSLTGDLAITGGSADLERRIGPVTLSVGAGALDVENGATAGSFVDARLTATLVRGYWYAAAEVRGQRNPLEDELGGGVALGWTAQPGVAAYLRAGRSLRDPVFGSAGTFTVSAGLSLRAIRVRPEPPVQVARVGEPVTGGRVVRFSIRAPDSNEVALLGDFTGWDPVPMTHVGDRWSVSLTVEPGLHHFGFLVDGTWALPPDAPGQVDDGWGRRNASIVVEP